ncbi:hypothetical protein FOPG_17199 [Fusarium oxysporum f. sp. conglutinans race 2 54008]|uniref:Uncharacterized protein n=1 Tax=Fusarium oxysporum f. sp. conglutinans race 2 54008 TaxID=1089457 RepID=X0GSP2_FUSOX|nr:hypothetical protein FOPG_17199 [Fusarium oxysporum f. sp. conglutinans race 2 54008]
MALEKIKPSTLEIHHIHSCYCLLFLIPSYLSLHPPIKPRRTMKAVTILLSICLAVRAMATDMCSTYSRTPCICPAGTEYAQSASWAVVGANAKDVEELMNDYFECGWRGSVPYETLGPNNHPGKSVRVTTFKTLQGIFNFSEILTDQRVQSDGSFIQKFEYLSTIPGSNKNGTQTPWGGYWITITADHIFGNETLIRWSTYLCSRGYVNDFNKFHEIAFNGAINTLQSKGKVNGINVAAFSI